MPEPLRIQGLLVKEETTYGTDAAPSASVDGVRGVGFLWSALNGEFVFPNDRDDTMSNSLYPVAPAVPRGRIRTFEYTVQLMGAGAAYSSATPVRPPCDPLLRACAMSRTHVDTSSAEKVTYSIADTGHSSCTVWAYAGNKLFKLVGCRGTWTWNPTAGGLGTITFRMMGMLTSVTNAAVASITYSSVVPPAAVAMGLAVVPNGGSSWTPKSASLEIDAGVEPQRFDDVSAADGIEGFFVTGDIKTKVRIAARVIDLSTYDPWALMAARTVQTIDLTLGGTQYNRVKLDVNLAYGDGEPEHTEENGAAAYRIPYRARDLSIVFD